MNTLASNIGTIERVMRIALGSLLLSLVFRPEFPPYLFALTAPYPVITAIMAWDPLYALFDGLKQKFSTHQKLGRHAHA